MHAEFSVKPRVLIESDDDLSANFPTSESSKAYADACWQANPLISPDYWRVWEGLTLSKLAWLVPPQASVEDMRKTWQNGVNCWLITGGSCGNLRRFLGEEPAARGSVVLFGLAVCRQDALHLDLFKDLPLSGLIAVMSEREQDLEPVCTQLEQVVRDGAALSYGIASEFFDADLPLEILWQAAQQAAQTIWQRRKRPALRMLGLPFNAAELNILKDHVHTHKGTRGEECVSALEWAARANIGVLALRPTLHHSGEALNQPTAFAQTVAQTLMPRIDETWHTLDYTALLLNLCASTPGITAAVWDQPVLPEHLSETLQTHADFADVGGIWGVF